MLQIYTEQQFSIGVIAQVKQPVVVANTLMNVPEEGVYSWEPGAQFGVYRPDTFWFKR
jgi:peptide/nickel transport system substrate-binding protein